MIKYILDDLDLDMTGKLNLIANILVYKDICEDW